MRSSITTSLLHAGPASPAAPVVALRGSSERESIFEIEGMHCSACAGTAKSALMAVSGVVSAEVNASTRRARVVWDAQVANERKLSDAVSAAGYRAVWSSASVESAPKTREARQALWQLLVAMFCMMQVMMFTSPAYWAEPGDITPDLLHLLRWGAWVLTLPVMAFSVQPFFMGAWLALKQRRIGMDVPVALGIAITFAAGTNATFNPHGLSGGEAYLDSLTMFVTFLLAGRWLEQRARARNTAALEALLHRAPQQAHRLNDTGGVDTIPASELKIGDRVRVLLGEAFPADGVVIDGSTLVDESMLTGESRPLGRKVGGALVGGTLNVGSPVSMRVDAVGEGTRQHQISQLVERALTERPAFLREVDRFAGPFLWGVLLLAAAAAVAWSFIDPSRAVWVAVSVLIVTCPCALSLATPAALLSAAGNLARRGVLVQRLDAIEALSKTTLACLDKTGTLTQDRLVLSTIDIPAGADRTSLLDVAGSLAALSWHPVSRALAQALNAHDRNWFTVREVVGQGVEATDGTGQCWRLGAPNWVGVPVAESQGRVRLACGRQDGHAMHRATFVFDEVLRPDALQTVRELKDEGLSVQILSGDGTQAVRKLGVRLQVDGARGDVTPEQKLAELSAWQAQGHRVLMVGDGVNDGPVLARADASFAMAQSSALAQQRADFIMLGNRLADVPAARLLARRTVRVMRQNIVWAVLYNAACVPLALTGWMPPWLAGAGMAISSLGVVLNALRLSR